MLPQFGNLVELENRNQPPIYVFYDGRMPVEGFKLATFGTPS